MKRFFILFILLSSTASFAGEYYDYFKQFMYQENVDDTDPENIIVQTRYIMSSYNAAAVPLPNGDSLRASVEIFLQPNDEFVAYYNEYRHPAGNPNSFFPNGCRKITGKWSVPEQKLILPGIGYAEKATVSGQQGMIVTISQKIISPEISNYRSEASLGFSNRTLDQMFCW